MHRFFIIAMFLLLVNVLHGQRISNNIDSSSADNIVKVKLIRSYYESENDSIAKLHWNPSLRFYNNYNFSKNIETYSRTSSPKQINKHLGLSITELESVNDTLSYVKIDVDYPGEGVILTYKYYIVKIGNKYYLDNCIDYEKGRFKKFSTENIIFYISPLHKRIGDHLYTEANKTVDSLYNSLPTLKKRAKFEVFLCSSVEEVNLLSNLTRYYSKQLAFANPDFNTVVMMYDSPIHKHEFVHAVVGGDRSDSRILNEGIATLYGGLSPQQGFNDGIKELKILLKKEDKDLEQVFKANNSTIVNYTIYGLIAEFLEEKLGRKELFALHYDKEINDKNLIEIASQAMRISVPTFWKLLHNFIVQHD